MNQWMEWVDGKLVHHIVMENAVEGKPLHMTAQGESHFGRWLMTKDERSALKEYQDNLDNLDEWNKFSDYGIGSSKVAYAAGEADRNDFKLRNEGYGASKHLPDHKVLVNRSQLYYDAGFYGKIPPKVFTVFQCPWHDEPTSEYYRTHPMVQWVLFKEPRPYNTKNAIRDRGTDAARDEFIRLVNSDQLELGGVS